MWQYWFFLHIYLSLYLNILNHLKINFPEDGIEIPAVILSNGKDFLGT